MNLKIILKTIGKLLHVEAVLLVIPLITSLYYKENNYYSYLIPIFILIIIGFCLQKIKADNMNFYAKEGFATVGMAWLTLSAFGALPLMLSGVLPNFFDAFFETASGFTTTGASVIKDVEVIYKSIQLWRSLTVWIGGMGILVFILAILPKTNSRAVYLLKAESTGPKVGKLTPKLKLTARILYLIYFGLTIILVVLLAFKIPFFDSLNYALSSAGTGGFAIHNNSLAHYDSLYVEIVITIFITLFGINFSVFYLFLIGSFKQALKSEELRYYLLILFSAILLISLNTLKIYNNFFTALRYSSFQAASIMTTTGFSTVDFNLWPEFSKWIIIILMYIGGSAGSTAGGIKISRIIIYFKTLRREIKTNINPNEVIVVKFEDKKISDQMSKGLFGYFIAHFFILLLGVLIISIDGFDLITNFSSTLTCLSNVGPGLNLVGPASNFSLFSTLSKFTLSIIMIIGRLELFPILILFSPRLYIKK